MYRTKIIKFKQTQINRIHTSLARQPLLPKEGERVWSNAYRARVPAHCIVRANQMHGIKSHDCAGMKGMQINDCAHA